ncbi:hypothetical protein [Blastococcus sp. TF02A-35]|uniref:hypothetical protein n=1 Tax=Blastococcus sp. TF02A-35 TaxID=2559612 RepID=UPI001074653F|nr:hypothetical protein [Blastococcus sp. TF02A_35]TFV44638.1 hypothetical protein E4P43_18540 [Blastococcus sp. TF02A_35]
MADLAYSLGLLSNLGVELVALAADLEGTSRSTSWDPVEVGHRTVAAALEDFAESWADRRELLTRALEDVGGLARAGAETFQRVDEGLAGEVRDVTAGR